MSYRSGILRTDNRYDGPLRSDNTPTLTPKRKTKKPWGKSRGARNLLGAATPEFEAKRKVKWKGKNCSSCGWQKGVGHDRWCEFVEAR